MFQVLLLPVDPDLEAVVEPLVLPDVEEREEPELEEPAAPDVPVELRLDS